MRLPDFYCLKPLRLYLNYRKAFQLRSRAQASIAGDEGSACGSPRTPDERGCEL